MRRYSEDNKEALAERRQKYKEANREHLARKQREYYNNNRDAALEYMKKYREENAAVVAERKLKHQQDNPHLRWASTYRQRCKRLDLTPVLEHFTKTDVIDLYGSSCFYCGGEFQELDHYVPVRRGGTHTLGNVRPSCTSCNRSKMNADPEVWIASRADAK